MVILMYSNAEFTKMAELTEQIKDMQSKLRQLADCL
jgi:hypothetical protein